MRQYLLLLNSLYSFPYSFDYPQNPPRNCATGRWHFSPYELDPGFLYVYTMFALAYQRNRNKRSTQKRHYTTHSIMSLQLPILFLQQNHRLAMIREGKHITCTCLFYLISLLCQIFQVLVVSYINSVT